MREALVIGGGASPLHHAWGSWVDSMDHVVRMFDCDWQDEPRYGSRYDEGFFLINSGPSYERWPEQDPAPVQWVGAITVERFRDMIPTFRSRAPFELYEATHLSERSRSLTKDAPARPTVARGVVAACWVIVRYTPLTLWLMGFDHLKAGKMTRSAHRQQDPYAQGKRFVGRWDPVSDLALLRHVAERRHVELRFKDE